MPVLEAGLKYNLNRSVQKIETSFTPSRHPSGKELGNQMCAAVLSSDEVAAEWVEPESHRQLEDELFEEA